MKKILLNSSNFSRLQKSILLVGICLSFFTNSFGQVPNHLVISQVYGGGGNTSAVYLNDYIELFNPTNAPVDLTNWSVQYASAKGTSWNNRTFLSGTVAPHSYFLIQESSGGVNGSPLPTPDATGILLLSATAGKLALCNDTTALLDSCPTGATIIDFVGYGLTPNCFEGVGPTPAPSNTLAIFRQDNGCQDLNDNSTDFVSNAPSPRNSSSPTNTCNVGINEANNKGAISIFPNPTKGIFTISTSNLSSNATVEIFNSVGEKVYSAKFLKSVDISNLPNGLYWITLTDGKNTYRDQLLKN